MNTSPPLPKHHDQLSDCGWLDEWDGSAPPWDVRRLKTTDIVPTMLTRRELDYLHWIANRSDTSGRIIELGCFLGGSTAALIAGLKSAGKAKKPLLVYDSFTAPDDQAFHSAPELKDFGLEPNTSFREMYERLHTSRMQLIEIREGMIQPELPSNAAELLYPEQEPISLLFIDIAKQWGVHCSILQTFFKHLLPNAIVVQQDFGDFRVPWLPIHMWQLRSSFEPLHRIGSSSMFSFRTATQSPELTRLGTNARDVPTGIWSEIESYWASYLRPHEDVHGWLSGYRASNSIHAGRAKETVEAAECFEQWRASSASQGIHQAPGWDEWLAQLPQRLTAFTTDKGILQTATHLAEKSLSRIEQSSCSNESTQWQNLNQRLKACSADQIVIYGSGRHTRKLFAQKWLRTDLPIRCIIDDNPSVPAIAEIEVLNPEGFIRIARDQPTTRFIILPSSDTYESELIERARLLCQQTNSTVLPIYTANA